MASSGPLIFHVSGSVIQLRLKQPPDSPPDVPQPPREREFLQIDLKDGRMQRLHEPSSPCGLDDQSPTVLGVIGLMRLPSGSILALITRAKKVLSTPHPVFKVTGTQLITHESVKKSLGELRIASLFQDALDVKSYGQHMYFSYKRDLTKSLQARQGGGDKGGGPDERFVFNRELFRPFVESGAARYALPLTVGYFGQVLNPIFRPIAGEAGVQGTKPTQEESPEDEGEISGNECPTIGSDPGSSEPDSITLIARMHVGRAGTMMWRKGLDVAGNNAHTFEIEQEVSLKGQHLHLSHIQLRASVPLIWSQKPWVLPRGGGGGIEVNTDMEVQRSAFGSFVESLVGSYGSLTLVNVPSRRRGLGHGVGAQEDLMHLMLRSLSLELCKPGNLGSPQPLSLLIFGERGLAEEEGGFPGDSDQSYLDGCFLLGDPKSIGHFSRHLEPSILKHSYFTSSSDASLNKEQTGVLHTSCRTAIDDSHLACYLVGMRVLEQQLRDHALLDEGRLYETNPEVHRAMSKMWTHAGNVTGDQLSGVGSLSSPALRLPPGSPHSVGLLPRLLSGYFSCERWFHGSFLDSYKQDAVDLVIFGPYGHSQSKLRRRSSAEARGGLGPSVSMLKLKRRENNYGAIEMGLLLLGWGVFQSVLCVVNGWWSLEYLAAAVLLPLLIAAGMIGYVLSLGNGYLEQPQVAKDLV